MEREKTIACPSGDQLGLMSKAPGAGCVSGRACLPFASASQIADGQPLQARPAAASSTNATERPSGDHGGFVSFRLVLL